jgi:Holliday junction resolvase
MAHCGIKNMDMTQEKKNRPQGEKATTMDYLSIAIQQQSVSPTEHLRFMKRNARTYFRDSQFWQSPLPTLHLEQILDSDLQAEYFTELFAKKENANPHLIQVLAMEAIEMLQKYFKLTLAHRKPEFRSALYAAAVEVDAIKRFASEIKWIANYEAELGREKQQRHQFFLQFPLDQLIFAFLLWHQKLKVSDHVRDNWHRLVALEVGMWEEINEILKLYAQARPKLLFANYFRNQSQINREWHYYAAKRMYEKEPDIFAPLPKEYEFLMALIHKTHIAWHEQALFERYCAGMGVLSTENGHAILVPNGDANRFEYDDRKGAYEERYFLSTTGWYDGQFESYKKGESPNHPFETKVAAAKLSFYGEPLSIKPKEQEIDLLKAIQLLQVFSAFKAPERRNYTHFSSGEVYLKIANNGPEFFRAALGPNEYLSIFEASNLPSQIAQAMSWTLEEATCILDHLTWDIRDSKTPTHWRERPFLKLGDKILWVGAVLADRNWLFSTHLRFRSNEFPPQFQNQCGKAFEQQIEKSFNKAGFFATQGVPFTTSTQKSGDIDVLAYKDRCLFIVEAKNALVELGFIENSFVEIVRFEAKAVYQLHKCLEYARESKAELLMKLKVPLEEWGDLDSLQIYPIIVARHFEGDQRQFGQYLKLSYLELEIILTNGLDHLYGTGITDHRIQNSIANAENPHFIPEKFNNAAPRDLWQGQNSLTPEIIIHCIEQGLVWKEFHETWKY